MAWHIEHCTVLFFERFSETIPAPLLKISAKRTQLERGDTGPLRPCDLLEARETLAKDGRGPPLRSPAPRELGLVGGGSGGGSGGSLLGGEGVPTKGNPI